MGTTPSAAWPRRPVPAELASRYRAEGWWTDRSLGDVVAHGLTSMGDVRFRVLSRPIGKLVHGELLGYD